MLARASPCALRAPAAAAATLLRHLSTAAAPPAADPALHAPPPPPSPGAPPAARHARAHGRDDPAALALRAALLAAALRHVPARGWQDALPAAAAELSYPAVASAILPGGPVELVWHVMREAQAAQNAALAAADLGALPVNARIALAVRARLTVFAAHQGAWASAMALGAAPAALPTTLALLAAAADDAWHAAGDRSVDASWYSRRALLMGVSAAAELFMLTDHSPGHADTWAFVERRLEELSSLSARGAEGAAVAAAAGAGAGAVAEGVMAMLRPCLGRDGEGLARLLPQPPSGAPSPAQALQALLQAAEQAARAANLPSPIDVGQALLAQLAPRPKAQRSSGGSGEELR
jgi:ubiquinone biosynthesis protein COQ9